VGRRKRSSQHFLEAEIAGGGLALSSWASPLSLVNAGRAPHDPNRPRLVGIRRADPGFRQAATAGAHIVLAPDDERSMGWVTSVTRSVEHERWIGLAMVQGGAERHGQHLFATFPLKNEVVEVEITSPHHVDPENARVRA